MGKKEEWKLARQKARLRLFRAELPSLARRAAERTGESLQEQIRENITPPGGLSLDELADAGHPLGRGSRFKLDDFAAAAGLDKRYQIIRQSGGLLRALGIDYKRHLGATATSAFVGFDEAGQHSSRTVSGKMRTVDMNDLINWLLNGTSTLVGRPVLINSLADAVPKMREDLRDIGLFPISIARARRQAVDR